MNFKKLLALPALVLALTITSQAQVVPTTTFVLTNLPASVAASTTVALYAAGTIPTNNVLSLRQGAGLASAVSLSGTAGAASAFTVNWSVSLDGTNWQTSPFAQTVSTANGTNSVTAVTNFSASVLNNILFIAPQSVVNANASVISLGNVTASFGNTVPGSYP